MEIYSVIDDTVQHSYSWPVPTSLWNYELGVHNEDSVEEEQPNKYSSFHDRELDEQNDQSHRLSQ